MHISQAEIAALEAIGQLLMIEAEQFEDRRVEGASEGLSQEDLGGGRERNYRQFQSEYGSDSSRCGVGRAFWAETTVE